MIFLIDKPADDEIVIHEIFDLQPGLYAFPLQVDAVGAFGHNALQPLLFGHIEQRERQRRIKCAGDDEAFRFTDGFFQILFAFG